MSLLADLGAIQPIHFALIIPAVAAGILVLIPGYRLGSQINIVSSFLTLLNALAIFHTRPEPNYYLFVDDFNIYLVVLTDFISFTTSAFSASYLAHEKETGRLTRGYARFYHAMFQCMILSMNLALLSNSLGLMWVAVEAATMTTVIMVGIYRTEAAIRASWKYFMLTSLAISLALFGITLIYFTASVTIGSGPAALAWTVLRDNANLLDPAVLNVAFVFAFVGFGTKVGLVPCHAWLPDAHSEGPTPISAVLSGLLLNVGLYALLRFKMIIVGNGLALEPGPLMVGVGLVSLLFGSLMLYRRWDIKRLFSYSSIEHMGLITFAFGMGGPLANLAGLLHMVMHSLTKSAIFFVVGHVAQVKGTQDMAKIRGLTTSHPVIGWLLVVGVISICGLPPSGLFMSEFLLITTTFSREPILAVILVLGLLIALGNLIPRLHALAFGVPEGNLEPLKTAIWPLVLHLGLVLGAGLYLPEPLFAWFQHVAAMLG